MTDSTAWPTFRAQLGYYGGETPKVIAEIEYKSPNQDAAESFANRMASQLFDVQWGPHYYLEVEAVKQTNS